MKLKSLFSGMKADGRFGWGGCGGERSELDFSKGSEIKCTSFGSSFLSNQKSSPPNMDNDIP
jgi:hypothetical protein